MSKKIRIYITLGWDCDVNRTSYHVSDTSYIPYDVDNVELYNTREKQRRKQLLDRLRHNLDKGTLKYFNEDEVICEYHKLELPEKWINLVSLKKYNMLDIKCWNILKESLKYEK